MANRAIVDCGHAPSTHGEHTTGTAHTGDGREICWGCSHAEEVAFIRAGRAFVAYLSGDGRSIVDWPGGTLATVVASWTRRVGFGGERIYLQVVDGDGQRWHGTAMGRGMIARLRRTQRGTS